MPRIISNGWIQLDKCSWALFKNEVVIASMNVKHYRNTNGWLIPRLAFTENTPVNPTQHEYQSNEMYP